LTRLKEEAAGVRKRELAAAVAVVVLMAPAAEKRI
jgi:hypothetical protein